MALDDDIRILSGVSIFEDLSGDQLRLLAFGAERLTLAKDRELYREGQNAECGYVVASGEIHLFREQPRGRQIVQSVKPGMILGELALVTQTTRLTGAVAAEESQVIRINRSLFRRMLEEYPETAAALHERLSVRLKEMLRAISRLDRRFEEN